MTLQEEIVLLTKPMAFNVSLSVISSRLGSDKAAYGP